MLSLIAENFKNIKRRIGLAAERAGRNPADIRLVAVTKEHSVTVVAEGIRAGSKIFGENKVQDAKEQSVTPRQNQSVDPEEPELARISNNDPNIRKEAARKEEPTSKTNDVNSKTKTSDHPVKVATSQTKTGQDTLNTQ